jgi:hypothetical protein
VTILIHEYDGVAHAIADPSGGADHRPPLLQQKPGLRVVVDVVVPQVLVVVRSVLILSQLVVLVTLPQYLLQLEVQDSPGPNDHTIPSHCSKRGAPACMIPSPHRSIGGGVPHCQSQLDVVYNPKGSTPHTYELQEYLVHGHELLG